MANDWFYRPTTKPSPPPAIPEVLEADPVAAEPPQFDCAEMDRLFALALAAIDADGLMDGQVPYDPRFAVVRSYFLSASRGELSEPKLVASVRAELATMRHDLVAITLGFELAKAGFLALNRPHLAAQFAREAGRGIGALRQAQRVPMLPPDRSGDDR